MRVSNFHRRRKAVGADGPRPHALHREGAPIKPAAPRRARMASLPKLREIDMNLRTGAERAHDEALSAMRRAIRAGDLAKAERWAKIAAHQYRNMEYMYVEASRWKARREKARAAILKP